MAEEYHSHSTFAYVMNNPISLFDIDGQSTYTDQDGNVIKIYDDDKTDIYRVSINQSDYDGSDLTSESGELIGNSVHVMSFADFEHFEENGASEGGTLKIGDGAKIDFESTEAGDAIANSLDEIGTNFAKYALNATGEGDYNLKVHLKGKSYGGSQISKGLYGSNRDAGNILAGAAANQCGLSKEFAFEGFGALNQSGNNVKKAGMLFMFSRQLNAVTGTGIFELMNNYGEAAGSFNAIKYGYEKYKKN